MNLKAISENNDIKIICEICDNISVKEYGILQTINKNQSPEKIEIYLCRSCLFSLIAHLGRQRELLHLFDEK